VKAGTLHRFEAWSHRILTNIGNLGMVWVKQLVLRCDLPENWVIHNF